MLSLIYERQFGRDLEKSKKRNKNIKKLLDIINLLQEDKNLSVKNKNHKLKGEYSGYWECHIEPDWLLVYQKNEIELILVRTGTHSDLFR